MEKKGCLIFLFVFLLIINVIGITGKPITGEAITGESITGEAAQSVGMGIFVTAYFPLLSILSPENKTYLTNESLLLNYSVSNEQAIWYNIDNLFNITITSPIYFNTSQGSHILYLYANSSFGNITSKNVSFTVSSEIPVEAPYIAPSGGGGRTTVTYKKSEFEVEPGFIEVIIKKGETFRSSIKIKNNGTSTSEFKIETNFLKDSIFISESEFSLKPQEEKEVIIIFSPLDSLKEDTYAGKIKISSEGQEKEIPVIFSLKSKIVLFDLTLIIPPAYKEVKPDGEILFQISIFNLGGGGRADVEITYYIKDFEGNTITEQKGVVGVETQASFSRIVKLPKDIKEGQYIVGANARYNYSIGTASDIFNVKIPESGLIRIIIPISIILSISLILLVILLIFYFKRKIKKELNLMENKLKKNINEGKIKEAKKIISESRKRGYNNESLKKIFIEKGWPEKLIDKLLK